MTDQKLSAQTQQEAEDILGVSLEFRTGFYPTLSRVLRARIAEKKPVMHAFLGLVEFAAAEVSSSIRVLSAVEGADTDKEKLASLAIRMFERSLKVKLDLKSSEKPLN